MEKHWACLRPWWEGRFGWGMGVGSMGGFISGSMTAGTKEMPKKRYLRAGNPSLYPNQGNSVTVLFRIIEHAGYDFTLTKSIHIFAHFIPPPIAQ